MMIKIPLWLVVEAVFVLFVLKRKVNSLKNRGLTIIGKNGILKNSLKH